MQFIHSHAFQAWAVQFLAVLFLVGGLAVLAVGVGLVGGSARTLRFFTTLNRWVSTRRAGRPFEIPHDTRQAVQKHRRWLAVVFVAGAAFALYGLGARFDVRAAGFMFGIDTQAASGAAWLVESVRYVLIAGNLAAVVIGIMLGFFPHALTALEARGGRWYSDRQLVKGANTMNLALDKWVAASPRAAGWIMVVAGLVLAIDFGIILLGPHY